MKGRTLTSLGLLAIAFLLAAGPVLAGFEMGYYNDFQKSLDKWSPGSSAGRCVTKDALKLAFERLNYTKKSVAPQPFNGYALLTNNCVQPVWMVANLTGTGNKFRIEFDARSVTACEACIAIAYAGQSFPKYPGQFTTDYKSVGKSWGKHAMTVSMAPSIDSGQDATTVIAIGFTNLDDTADSGPQQFGIDNLTVTLDGGSPPKND